MPVVINEFEETAEAPAAGSNNQGGTLDPALIQEQVEKALELQRERRQRSRAY